MISDLESHITKVPIYVSYLLKHIHKYVKKELDKKKADKKEYAKLKMCLFRLFYKNIISKLIKRLSSDNNDFLMQLIGYKSDSTEKKIVE